MEVLFIARQSDRRLVRHNSNRINLLYTVLYVIVPHLRYFVHDQYHSDAQDSIISIYNVMDGATKIFVTCGRRVP